MRYSSRWFKNATDEELRIEREKVRTAPVPNWAGETQRYNLLLLFDNEMIKRMNKKDKEEHPNAKPRSREHGWYLPNDD